MIETERAFVALREEYVEVSLRHDPVAATRAGVHDYDAKLPDHSPDGVRERAAWLRDLDQRLVASVPWEELPIAPRVEFAYLRSLVAVERVRLEDLQSHAVNASLPPATALDGIFQLASRQFAPIEERKEVLLERLMAIPEYLEGARLNLQQCSAASLTAAHDLDLGGPAYLDAVVRELLRAFPGEAERIEHAGERARAGFFQYEEHLEREIRPRGAGQFAIGERWFNHLLEREHLLVSDGDAIEADARGAAEKLERELEREARALDAGRPWAALIAEARRQHPEPLRLREAYEAEIVRAQRFVRERLPIPLPLGALEVIETPEYMQPAIPFVGYEPPAPLDAECVGSLLLTPVNFGLTPEAQDEMLRGHDEVTLSLRVVREIWPGEHLHACAAAAQGSRLRRLASSPLTRGGWASDVTDRMLEAGFFLDPRSRMFVLRDRLETALMALVDIGLHRGALEPAAAERLLIERAQTLPAAARSMVRRAVLHPARSLCPFMGGELLGDLRREWRDRLREKYDGAVFDAGVLAAGALPLFLVREQMLDSLAPRKS